MTDPTPDRLFPDRLFLDRLSTPIGVAVLVTDGDGLLRALDWEDYRPRMLRLLRLHYGAAVTLDDGRAPAPVRAAIDDYFSGRVDALRAIGCATAGTPFQRRVWGALRDIPVGATTSYGALALRLGAPTASRAVGLANGANPIGVVVPCHRVVGANGSLTGYGGGLARKRWLLAHESGQRAVSCASVAVGTATDAQSRPGRVRGRRSDQAQ